MREAEDRDCTSVKYHSSVRLVSDFSFADYFVGPLKDFFLIICVRYNEGLLFSAFLFLVSASQGSQRNSVQYLYCGSNCTVFLPVIS